MKFWLSLIILMLFSIKDIFAYIDPGTGGYILSSIWAWLVGMLAILFGMVLRFFKYHVKNFVLKNKILSIIILLLIIGLPSYFLYSYYTQNDLEYSLNEYDEKLNGVQVYDETSSYNGYNLFEGNLMNMKGDIVKTWDFKYLSTLDKEGNYYAQKSYESLEWGKFSFEGNPIWIKNIPIHHEIYISPSNTIFTFTKETQTYNGRLVEFDVILEFDQNGTEISRWSTWDSLSELKKWHKPLELDKPASFKIPEEHKKNLSIWGANYDYYHLNAFSVVPPNSREKLHKAFTPGNWIVSFRHGSMLFILDKDTKEVLWTGIYDQIKDNLEGQHAPSMLSNGNMLIFDNGRYRGWSRILELDVATLKPVKEYKSEDFFTYSQGYVQVLPNENYLVTESEDGRVFELTKNDEIAWEYYYNQSTQSEEFGLVRDDIYRMIRYDESFINNLLENGN